MSLYDNVLDEADDMTGELNKSVKVWDWVRSKMNIVKFRERAVYANKDSNRNTEVKVVLMEYPSSWKHGDSATEYYVPGTYINTSCLQRDDKVIDYLHYQIADRDPTVQVYARRKVVDGKNPHPYLRQLVVKFNVKQPEAVPIPPCPVETLDESDDDMPPLTVGVPFVQECYTIE